MHGFLHLSQLTEQTYVTLKGELKARGRKLCHYPNFSMEQCVHILKSLF